MLIILLALVMVVHPLVMVDVCHSAGIGDGLCWSQAHADDGGGHSAGIGDGHFSRFQHKTREGLTFSQGLIMQHSRRSLQVLLFLFVFYRVFLGAILRKSRILNIKIHTGCTSWTLYQYNYCLIFF